MHQSSIHFFYIFTTFASTFVNSNTNDKLESTFFDRNGFQQLNQMNRPKKRPTPLHSKFTQSRPGTFPTTCCIHAAEYIQLFIIWQKVNLKSKKWRSKIDFGIWLAANFLNCRLLPTPTHIFAKFYRKTESPTHTVCKERHTDESDQWLRTPDRRVSPSAARGGRSLAAVVACVARRRVTSRLLNRHTITRANTPNCQNIAETTVKHADRHRRIAPPLRRKTRRKIHIRKTFKKVTATVETSRPGKHTEHSHNAHVSINLFTKINKSTLQNKFIQIVHTHTHI